MSIEHEFLPHPTCEKIDGAITYIYRDSFFDFFDFTGTPEVANQVANPNTQKEVLGSFINTSDLPESGKIAIIRGFHHQHSNGRKVDIYGDKEGRFCANVEVIEHKLHLDKYTAVVFSEAKD